MNIKVGDSADFQKTISETDVYLFAGISGDFNPVHIDEEASRQSVFGRRIVHGLMVGSLLSSVIGMKLPGPGTIYIEQSFRFKSPAYIGDTLKATVYVSEVINLEKRVLRLLTSVSNQNNEQVIDGYAVVKAPEGVCIDEQDK